jgi:hypothetical protein
VENIDDNGVTVVGGENGGSGNNGDANGNGRPDWTEDANGYSKNGTTGSAAGDTAIWHSDGDSLLGVINQEGFLSHSCPPMPAWDLGPLGTFDVEPAQWCDLVAALGAIVVLGGTILSLWILMD